MRQNNSGLVLRNTDLVTFSIFLALVGIGWMMIYTVNLDEMDGVGIGGFFFTTIGKQTIWIILSLLVFFFIFLIDWKFWRTFAYPIYAITMIFLAGVLVFGTTIKNATSWYTIGGFSIQPSEFAKLGTALAVAGFLSAYSTNLKQPGSILTVLGIILLPFVLIVLQPDPGSALVFLSFFIVFFREGLSSNYYAIGISATTLLIIGLVSSPVSVVTVLLLLAIGVMAYQMKPQLYWVLGSVALIVLTRILTVQLEGSALYILYGLTAIAVGLGLWLTNKEKKGTLARLLAVAVVLGGMVASVSNYAFNNILKPHQQERINVWLQPQKSDPQGARYNVIQSQMAISSGGSWGKGFTNGKMTQLNYVPEQSTDFIFCTIGEEQGFVGSLGIIGLFLVLLLRFTIIAERQRSAFSRQFIYGVAGIFFIHFLINIGMTMGLMPVIGIPLPFISKGGSSLLGFSMMIGILLKLDANRYNI